MFDDIKIFLNDENLDDYDIKEDNGDYLFVINNVSKSGEIKVIYDENIYDLDFFDRKIDTSKAGRVVFDFNESTLSFKVMLNYKYFVKAGYKAINGFIDKEEYLKEIKAFKNAKVGQEYKDMCVSYIEEVEKTEFLFNTINDSKLYDMLTEKMDVKDIMLLITSYIAAKYVPKISQDTFDELVNEAANYDYAKENVWRLAMNFDRRGYDFSLIDDFFVDKRDSWYMAEYISGVVQVDQDSLIEKIIATNDKDFINKLLEDEFFVNDLDEELKELLKKAL